MEQSDSYDIELIERYLNGELKGDELNNFELMVEKDQKLAEKVDQIRALPDSLLVVERDRLSKEVKKWIKSEADEFKNSEIPKRPTKIISRRILSIAAIFIFVVCASGLWFLNNKGLDINAKANYHMAQVHQKPIVLRGSAEDSWEKAIEHYTNGSFDKMIQEMNTWVNNNTTTAEQLFYFALANAYSKSANYDVALDYLSRTEQRDSSTYRDEIAWYRALIFIRRDELDKARIELMKVKSSNRYGKGASELLEAME